MKMSPTMMKSVATVLIAVASSRVALAGSGISSRSVYQATGALVDAKFESSTKSADAGTARALEVLADGRVKCDASKDCQQLADNTVCNKGICECKKDYFFLDGECFARQICEDFCRDVDPNLFCYDPQDTKSPCACKHMYYPTKDGCKKYKNLEECDADCQDIFGIKDVYCDPKDTNTCLCKKKGDVILQVSEDKYKCAPKPK